jgi:hypothetical protein
VKRTDQKFDVISIDAPPPMEAAGTSLLYSREFYERVKSRLKDDGIVQQWICRGELLSAQAAIRAVADSFPHVRAFVSLEGWGLHLLGSMKPIPVRSADEILARMPPAVVADLKEWLPPQFGVKDAVQKLLRQEGALSNFLNAEALAGISDDRPFNEYFVMRRYFGMSPVSGAPAILLMMLFGAVMALIVMCRPRKQRPPDPTSPG